MNVVFNDPQRMVACGNCNTGQKVRTVFENQFVCIGCGANICMFCGCTDQSPCHHPDFEIGELTCQWTDRPGVCSFCHCHLAEEAYFNATGRPEKVKPVEAPVRQSVLLVKSFET